MEKEKAGVRTNWEIQKYSLLIIAIWSAFIIFLFVWDYSHVRRNAMENAKILARANYDKDIAFREWVTTHGGVYVPVDEATPPNPYLTDIPERDIKTPSGKQLTLMNPAYAARQMNEYFSKATGDAIFGHITSLKLKNPHNKPDEWEEEALKEFEAGKREADVLTEFKGKPYYRIMRPIFIKKGCLKCHGDQGYKIGDVRGGVSVSVSMAPFYLESGRDIRWHAMVYGTIWLLGAVGVLLSGAGINRLNSELEDRVRRRTAALNAANKELEDFSYAVSHDLRSPLRGMDGFSLAILEDYGDRLDDKGRDYLRRIRKGAVKMAELIEAIQRLSRVTREEMMLENVNLSLMASNVAENLRKQAPEQKVELVVEPGLTARADAKLLRLTLENLMGNAWKFTSKTKGARIEFGKISVGVETAFFVRDNGAGFDMAYKDKLFTTFQRLHSDEEFESAGIGLAFVKRIIAKHGGRIWGEGEPGKGATFYFTL